MAQLKLTWYDDLKAESDLRRMAVVFSKVSIPFAKIDIVESQKNGARLNDAIRHHKVDDYKQAFRNGDTFPRIVVHKTATGYVILSGNQRSEAIRQLIAEGELPKTVEVEAYLVDTRDKLLLELIARSANVAHGEGIPKSERLQMAVYFVRQLGVSAADAAKYQTVSVGAVREHIRAEEVRETLQKSGIEAHRLPTSSLVPLSKLDYDESAQVKIGTLATQHNPPAERIRQVVNAVSKQTTPQARVQKIKEFEKELADAAHASNGHGKGHVELEKSKVPARPRREKLITLLTRLSNFLESDNAGDPFTTLEQLQITTQTDKARVADLVKKLRYRLGVIVK